MSNIEDSIIGKKIYGGKLTQRERFRRTMHFQSVDRLPNFEFGYWDETLPTWHQQGLPAEVDNEEKANEFFGFEPASMISYHNWLMPAFEYQVLEETESHILIIDQDGVKCEINKDGSSSIPHFLEYPLKDRQTWNEIKKRLDYNTPDRRPKDLEKQLEMARKVDAPLGIWCGSLLGKLRDLMGFENIAIAFYDMPDLMHEMIEYMTEFTMRLMENVIKDVEFDFAAGWEDIAFKNGPIISPAMFREFLFPYYKKIGDFLHRHGVDIIYTDCDGNITPVVDQWIEAGYSCLFPVEVHAGTDPVELRKKYGLNIKFIGGVDKMKLRRDKSNILNEMKRIEPILNQGGFIPHVDHRCPPDVPYENYLYYLDIKKRMIGIK